MHIDESGGTVEFLCKTGHLETLDDAGDALVFEHGVLALRVLADDEDVDVLVARRHARERLAVQQVGEQVQLVAQLHVARKVVGPVLARLDVACPSFNARFRLAPSVCKYQLYNQWTQSFTYSNSCW